MPTTPQYTATAIGSEVTPRELVSQYRQLATRAAKDVGRRLAGLGGLFGEDVARPLSEAFEETTEALWGALEAEQLAHQQRDRNMVEIRREHDDMCRELRQDRDASADLLRQAVAEWEERNARTRPAFRKPAPHWYCAAVANEEAPF